MEVHGHDRFEMRDRDGAEARGRGSVELHRPRAIMVLT